MPTNSAPTARGQRPLPSTSTLHRALHTIDVLALESRVAQLNQTLAVPSPALRWHAQAVDGKAVHGAQL